MLEGLSTFLVYAFWKGNAYARNAPERLGRNPTATPEIVRIANKKRSALLEHAKCVHRVTWGDVRKATKKALKVKSRSTRRCQARIGCVVDWAKWRCVRGQANGASVARRKMRKCCSRKWAAFDTFGSWALAELCPRSIFSQCPYNAHTVPIQCPYNAH